MNNIIMNIDLKIQLIKKYSYIPFYKINNNRNIIIKVEIKHIYLIKIFQLLKRNLELVGIDNLSKIEIKQLTFYKSIINYINQEFF